MRPVQDLFPMYADILPKGWRWATIHYVFGEGRTSCFNEYGLSEDRSTIENDMVLLNKLLDLNIGPIFHELRNEIATLPLEQPTHIELTIEPDGKFNTVLGYGEPNWDIAPRPWPDDITADEYTYTKAWPNGIKEKSIKRLKDPRSLIGLVINKEQT